MKTNIIRVNPEAIDPEELRPAAKALAEEGW